MNEMTTWEYMKTALTDVDAMNRYGADGWELVATIQPFKIVGVYGGDPTTAWLYWKRPTPTRTT